MAIISSSGSASARNVSNNRNRRSFPLFANKSDSQLTGSDGRRNSNSINASQSQRKAASPQDQSLGNVPSSNPNTPASTPCSSQHLDSTPSSLHELSTLTSALKSAFQSSSKHSSKKTVSFDSIYIREHARDICLNPSVSSGPAVGLGWDFHDHPTGYDVGLFEETRPPRRSRAEFQLPRPVRERLLQDTGASRQELMAAMRAINVAKRQRQHSVATQETEGAHLAMEWLSGKVKKIVGRRASYAKEEERLWTRARILAMQRVAREQRMEQSSGKQ